MRAPRPPRFRRWFAAPLVLAITGAAFAAARPRAESGWPRAESPEPRAQSREPRALTLADSARARLSQIDGTIRVPGLDSAVEVRRDRWGVPHIYARTVHDLLFAQGYVAAQDRLWQMEMWRRQSEGRLAEVLGPAAVARDRYARAFRYRGDMAAEWASYAPDAKALVAAFVDGVNAEMAHARATGKLPIEFTMLGFEPEPWTVDVPLARVTGLSGVSNGSSEILRAQLVSRVGVKAAESILPSEPHRALDPAPGLDLTGLDQRSLGSFTSTFADIAYNRVEGSNNWVVSGARTATGKPILANDPHRVITNPAVRYITHLVGPGWNVIGAGEPASPGVSIGHNDRIAFGLTIVGMDQQDVYVEKVKACDQRVPGSGFAGGAPGAPNPVPATRCYWHAGKWEPVTTIIDTIRVKGASPRIVTLELTHHGPIVSVDSARSRAIAIRSVHQEPGTASYLASLSLDRARDWREFRAAMARWRMPSENMVYADVDGHIGWIASGLMPERSWSGMLPVPGDGSREWSGFLTIDQLPQAYDPRDGYIATANNDILPTSYTTPIAYDWATPYRVERIREVLTRGSRFTVADFARLQHDDLSLLARATVPALVDAARRQGASARADVKLLASWNYRMSRDQAAPLLFEAWAPLLARRVAALTLPSEAARLVGSRPDYRAVERWLGPGGGAVTSAVRDSALLGALDDATRELTKRFGADLTRWRWGAVHVAPFRHPLSREFDLPSPARGGDANTVYATGGRDFQQHSGASYREIIDLANFDNSLAINVPGQSAQPGSEHYADLLPLWGTDRYFPLVYSRAAVERETEHVLRLTP